MRLRPATPEDAEVLWQWRLDRGTWASWPTPPRLSRASHDAWVVTRCALPHCYMAEEEGRPIGTVRLETRLEIAVTIAPESRGHGFSIPMIGLAVQQAEAPVLARILPTNAASVKAFLRAGFTKDAADLYLPCPDHKAHRRGFSGQ